MAIIKADAAVSHLDVVGGVVYATVNYAYQDDSTDPNTELHRANTRLAVTNATSAELAAAQSLISKAAVLAVA